MKLVRESLTGMPCAHSHDGLQVYVSEVELSCWCAEAEHSGKVYVCLEDGAQLAIHNSPHLATVVSANDSAELWLPS